MLGLVEVHERLTVLAELVKWADVVDTYCIALHEVRAGNVRYVEVQVRQGDGSEIEVPMVDSELVELPHWQRELSRLEEVFQIDHPLLALPPVRTREEYTALVAAGQPHTHASLSQVILAGQPAMYAAWLRAIRESSDDLAWARLITRVE